MPEKELIVTVSGKWSSDMLPAVLEALERSSAVLADLQQFVVQDEVTLTMVIGLSEEGRHETDIVKELLLCAHEKKFFVEFDVVKKRSTAQEGQVYVITMISPAGQLSTLFLMDICEVVAKYDGNIETINCLSQGVCAIGTSLKGDGLICYEFFVRLRGTDMSQRLQQMREGLLLLAKEARGDIAVQRAGLVQRAKRLVVFDLSYTLITSDANDLFFNAAGVEIDKELAEKMHSGEVEYAEYLRRHVSLLKGMKASTVVEKALADVSYTEGAVDAIKALKKLGYKTAVISRGPRALADAVKKTLQMDFAYGNEIYVEGDKFTGELRTPTVDSERKAHLMHMMIMHEGISIEQVIAVGDGLVSSKMLSHAGLSVAFDQPQAVDGPVYGRIISRSLTSILYLLGITQRDIESMSNSA